MSYITVDELRIASPCQSAEWADMKGGDDRARLCLTCDKNVYNLSLMTLDEANDLIREKEGKLCIELYRRFDGTVLTADCPVGLRTIRRQYLKTRAKAIAFALALWGFITGTTTSCNMFTSLGIPALPPNFTAELNGKKTLNDSYVDGINDTTINEILIKGTTNDNSSLWIFLDSSERDTGTFINHHGVFPAGGFLANGSADSSFWFTGELKISVFNPSHASGTFWFNATRSVPGADTVHITNGTFDVSVFFGKIPK